MVSSLFAWEQYLWAGLGMLRSQHSAVVRWYNALQCKSTILFYNTASTGGSLLCVCWYWGHPSPCQLLPACSNKCWAKMQKLNFSPLRDREQIVLELQLTRGQYLRLLFAWTPFKVSVRGAGKLEAKVKQASAEMWITRPCRSVFLTPFSFPG